MKLKLLNNRGFAIESVIASGIVIFAMCTIITVVTFGTAMFNKTGKIQVETKEFRDEIADNYLSYLNDNEKGSKEFKQRFEKTINGTKYVYLGVKYDENSNDVVKFTLKDNNNNDKIVLTVEYTKDANNKYHISKWNYGE